MLESSWNTTPIPSGTSPCSSLPSKRTLPLVGRTSPATTSSKVDLPQPEGPTIEKNSPHLMSRLTGPSACTTGGPSKRRTTSFSDTCASPLTLRPSLRRPQVRRQIRRVDIFRPVDIALHLPGDLKALDHMVHG